MKYLNFEVTKKKNSKQMQQLKIRNKLIVWIK